MSCIGSHSSNSPIPYKQWIFSTRMDVFSSVYGNNRLVVGQLCTQKLETDSTSILHVNLHYTRSSLWKAAFLPGWPQFLSVQRFIKPLRAVRNEDLFNTHIIHTTIKWIVNANNRWLHLENGKTKRAWTKTQMENMCQDKTQQHHRDNFTKLKEMRSLLSTIEFRV